MNDEHDHDLDTEMTTAPSSPAVTDNAGDEHPAADDEAATPPGVEGSELSVAGAEPENTRRTETPEADAEPDHETHRIAEPGVAAAHPQTDDADAALLQHNDVEGVRTQWHQLQAGFIDNPHDAVVQADELVGEIIQRLAATAAERKETLTHQWSGEADTDTEHMRQAMRGYRTLLNQLLAI